MNLGLIQGRELNQSKIVIHPIPEDLDEVEIEKLIENTFGNILSIKFYKGNKKIIGISNASLIK